MKSAASVQSVVSSEEEGYREQFKAQFRAYLEKQPGIVRGLHQVLRVAAWCCYALPVIFFAAALYTTILWATTGSFTSLGQATYLPDAWVNFGLSLSFLVFPWGLDVMLLRAFPTEVIPGWRKPKKPVNFITGGGAILAGFGIMCAGAPGAARMLELAAQAIR
jgi:hypothetical protein